VTYKLIFTVDIGRSFSWRV